MSGFVAGQRWRYRTPAGFEDSRLVVGAVLAFASSPTIVCTSIYGAPQRLADGRVELVTIPFLPMTEDAVAATVVSPDGEQGVPAEFEPHFDAWRSDIRGLSYFTVSFEGFLDLMIARQMASMIGIDAQSA